MSIISNPRVEAARRGENPAVVRKMLSGWAVMCDWQKLPGYMILLADPVVESLNDLSGQERKQFLADMTLMGDALLEVTDTFRINYQILCNLDPILHAHICPRYTWEPEELRTGQVNHYDWSAGPEFDVHRDRDLMNKICMAIDNLEDIARI